MIIFDSYTLVCFSFNIQMRQSKTDLFSVTTLSVKVSLKTELHDDTQNKSYRIKYDVKISRMFNLKNASTASATPLLRLPCSYQFNKKLSKKLWKLR